MDNIEVNADSQASAPTNLVAQSEVNAVIKRVKQEAYDKGMRDAVSESAPAKQQFDEESFSQKVAEKAAEIAKGRIYADNFEAEEARKKKAAIDAVNANIMDYNEAIQRGTSEGFAEDYRKVLEEFPHEDFKGIYRNGSLGIPNFGQVIYELGKDENVKLLVEYNTLGLTSPSLYKKAVTAFASELAKRSQAVKNAPKITDPISNVKAQSVGVSGGTDSSIDRGLAALYEAKRKYRT